MGDVRLGRQLLRRRTDTELELDRILCNRLIEPVYQPIVSLPERRVVAFEALARGPVGSSLEMPNALFGAAARHDRVVELDWECRAAALLGAFAADLLPPAALFVNVEPEAAGAQVPAQFAQLSGRARYGLKVIFEFTERSLAEHPGQVLHAVRALRRLGGVVALDDVGVDARSLALLPFLEPEVVKLDMSVVHDPLTEQAVQTMHAIHAYAETSGAVILAEGIETTEHLSHATALGATHGQGWLFGRPGPIDSHEGSGDPGSMLIQPRVPEDDTLSPFELVTSRRPGFRTTNLQLLEALAERLELRAKSIGAEAVLLTCVGPRGRLTDSSRQLYESLAQDIAFVGVLGTDTRRDGAGVHSAPLPPSDPMAPEHVVCVLGPHFSGALVAKPRSDTPHQLDYQLTYDRTIVSRVARQLMARMPEPSR